MGPLEHRSRLRRRFLARQEVVNMSEKKEGNKANLLHKLANRLYAKCNNNNKQSEQDADDADTQGQNDKTCQQRQSRESLRKQMINACKP